MFSITPTQIAVDAPPTYLMRLVIRVLDGSRVERRELGFDGVEPGGIGWQVNSLHIMTRKKFVGRADIRGQIIHHDVNAQLLRIAGPQTLETGDDISSRFALTDAPDQTVRMNIIEPVQLLDAVFAGVGRPMALRMSVTSPAPACHRAQFQRT